MAKPLPILNKMKRLTSLFFTLTIAYTGFTQTDSTTLLSPKDFYNLVLKYHPVVQQAKLKPVAGDFNLLKARGGFIVDIEWNEGKLTYLSINSTINGICHVRVPNAMKPVGKEKLLTSRKTALNPFNQSPAIAPPLFAKGLKLEPLEPSQTALINFEAKKGVVYEFVMP